MGEEDTVVLTPDEKERILNDEPSDETEDEDEENED